MARANVTALLVPLNAKKHGLILRLVGNRIAFSPPLITSEAEVREMVRRLRSALDDTWGEVRAN